MMIKGYYEIIICCDQSCGEVIHFRYNGIIYDSNDIVTIAINEGFIGEENRKEIRQARSLSKNEFRNGG